MKNSPRSSNTFEKGVSRDFDPRRTDSDRNGKGSVLHDSVNGVIMFNDNGSLVWRPTNGNVAVLSFDANAIDPDSDPPVAIGQGPQHMPMGGCSFSDCCVIYTVNTSTNVTTLWVFQFNKERQVYGQILLTDLSFPSDDKFNGILTEPVVMRPVYENDGLYRFYWCDGVSTSSNPLRALSFKISGSVTNPTYGGATIVGTFKTFERLDGQSPSGTDIMAPWWPGRVWFHQRIPGQLLSGMYQYVYRQIRADGYRTPWSMPTNAIHNTVDAINMQNMHVYEMEAPNQQTAHGIRIMIQGIDTRYEKIEVGYVYITDPDVLPTVGASFAFKDVNVTGPDNRMEFDHVSMSGEPFSPDELDQLLMNIRGAKTIEVKDNRLWVGNYKTAMMSLTDAEVEAVLANFKIHHMFRNMCGDEKGKSDYCEDIHPDSRPYTHITPDTTTLDFWLSDGQFVTLPIVNDYRNYKGQQIANLYAAYQRGETVRLGIRFYDLVGQPGFVYHLCDYKFPKIYKGDNVADVSAVRIMTDGTLVNVLDDSLWLSGDMRNSWFTTNMGDDLSIVGGVAGALGTDGERPLTYHANDHALTGLDEYGWTMTLIRIMGLLAHGIDVSGIKSKISGYSIVRCPVEHTVVAQGLVSPCVIDGDEIRPMPRPAWAGVIDSDPSSGTYGRFQWATVGGNPLQDTDTVADSIYMSYNFLTMYFADVMFNPELRPGLQSGDTLELVQVLWEEYNNKNQVGYIAGEPVGRRMNLVHAGPTGSAVSRSTGDKLSWHLLNMSRERRHEASSVLDFNAWDGTHFTNPGNNFPATDEIILGTSTHPSTAAYNANWSAAEFMFPLYGSTIGVEYIKWVAMNEELPGIDTTNPQWEFLNKVRCYYGFGDADPLFGGISDAAALNIAGATISGGSRFEGIGHENTALVKYFQITGPNAEAAKYPLAAIFPSYAETSLGGPAVADGLARIHGPLIGCVSRWLVNWTRPLGAVYGGQTLTALQNNIFIPIGHFQPVNNPAFPAPVNDIYNRAELWGGDTYLDYHSTVMMMPNYLHNSGSSADPASREGADTGWIITFPMENRYNHVMRNAPSIGDPISTKVGIRPRQNYEGYTQRGSGGIFFYGGLNGRTPVTEKHYLEEFFISALMRNENRLHIGSVKPRGFIELDHFPLRWHYSDVKFYGSLVDAFRIFLVNNWTDTNGEYGPVEGSVKWNDEVFSFQRKAISRLRINERSLIKDEAGDTITTGDGQTLNGYDVKVNGIGTHHRMSIIATQKAIYFVDVDNRSIFMWAGDGEPVNLGMRTGNSEIISNVLRHYKDSQTVWAPQLRTGVFTGHDAVKGNIYFNLPSQVNDAVELQSQRYKYLAASYVNQSVDQWGNALPNNSAHDYCTIFPIDKGSTAPETSSTPHIRDQDIIIINNIPKTGVRPVYFDITLYRGLYSSTAFTVKEFYLVIRPESNAIHWAMNINNRYNPSPGLTDPNEIWPDRVEDMVGYRYRSPDYPHTFSNNIKAESYGVVLHFYRPDGDSVFQVRLLNGNNAQGNGLASWINPRSVFVYNEPGEVAQGWESVAAHFNLVHEGRLLQARENHSTSSLVYERVDHVRDTPQLFGNDLEAFMQYVMTEHPQLAKVFDIALISTAEMADVKEVRFSTEDQAILLSMSDERRAAFKRSILRMPIRTEYQLRRMKGTYLLVDVHINRRRLKVAYVAQAETIFRITPRA